MVAVRLKYVFIHCNHALLSCGLPPLSPILHQRNIRPHLEDMNTGQQQLFPWNASGLSTNMPHQTEHLVPSNMPGSLVPDEAGRRPYEINHLLSNVDHTWTSYGDSSTTPPSSLGSSVCTDPLTAGASPSYPHQTEHETTRSLVMNSAPASSTQPGCYTSPTAAVLSVYFWTHKYHFPIHAFILCDSYPVFALYNCPTCLLDILGVDDDYMEAFDGEQKMWRRQALTTEQDVRVDRTLLFRSPGITADVYMSMVASALVKERWVLQLKDFSLSQICQVNGAPHFTEFNGNVSSYSPGVADNGFPYVKLLNQDAAPHKPLLLETPVSWKRPSTFVDSNPTHSGDTHIERKGTEPPEPSILEFLHSVCIVDLPLCDPFEPFPIPPTPWVLPELRDEYTSVNYDSPSPVGYSQSGSSSVVDDMDWMSQSEDGSTWVAWGAPTPAWASPESPIQSIIPDLKTQERDFGAKGDGISRARTPRL
ncbi:hypothetical protein BOTBODRAFT_645126 [Botryobasidium botryosum FD-172 SS1]|uniref:Uncharacterized protein n=1 Tax=Botryobasidium botryosum (strain FD-172 SS1) TaxID=930990 RepID=A0A067LZV6_BOTB1|nr:hypothetical protein BOTBODRAFT_645126 [Botryobasidium botryosum FD-172 SS1]